MAIQNILRVRDFNRKPNVIDPPLLTPVLDMQVPRGEHMLLPHNQPFEMVLPQEETHTPNASGEYTFTLTNTFMDVPHLTDQEVVYVYDTVAEKFLTVLSVDYENKKVTVADAVSGNECKVFVPLSQGLVQIAVIAPVGFGSLRMPLFNRAINAVHGVNQYLATSPLRLREAPSQVGGQYGGWLIPETFRLQVLVTSKQRVTTDPAAKNYILNLHYRVAPASQFPSGTVDAVMAMMTNQGRG